MYVGLAFVMAVSGLTGMVSIALSHRVAAASYGDIIVRQSAIQGWSQAGAQNSGITSFVTDVSAPYGFGALEMKTINADTSKVQRVKSLSPNVKLSDITELSYWTKQVSIGKPTDTASIQIIVNGLTGTSQSATLVFEPYWNVAGHIGTSQNLTSGVWQQWNAKDGVFWSNKTYASAGLTNGAGGPPFYTLQQVIANNPNAKVTSLVLNLGTYNPNNISYVDGVSFNGVVYDFEPVAPVPPSTPSNLRLNNTETCGYATNVNYISPTWDAVPNAVSYNYKVELPDSSIFGPINVGNVTSISGAFGAEGTSRFSVQSVAANGLTSEWATSCAVSYDKTLPTGTDDLQSPIHGTVVVTQHINDNIAAKSGKLRIWKLTDGAQDDSKFYSIGYIDVDGSGNIQYTLDTENKLFGDGEYIAKFTSNDTAGNTAVTTQKKFTVDNTAPQITVKPSPDSLGDFVNNIYSEVSFKFYDVNKFAYATLNGFTFNPTDAVWGDFNNVVANKSWSGAKVGSNTLTLYDLAGNHSSFDFTIDTTPPTVTITNPTASAYNESVIVRGTVQDENLHHYWLHVAHNGIDIVNQTINATTGFIDQDLFTATEEGYYVVTLAARDSADIRSVDVTKSFTIDKTAPSVSIPSYTTVGNVITPNVVADDSDVVSYSWTPTSVVGLSAFSTSTKTPSFTVTADGTYALTLTVVDALGNARSVVFNFTYTTPLTQVINNDSTTATTGGNTADDNTGFTDVTAEDVLGTQDTNTEQQVALENDDEANNSGVAGATDENNESSDWASPFGLAWYWWLLILAAVAGGLWWFFAARRAAKEE